MMGAAVDRMALLVELASLAVLVGFVASLVFALMLWTGLVILVDLIVLTVVLAWLGADLVTVDCS
jgi:hypothetical protein